MGIIEIYRLLKIGAKKIQSDALPCIEAMGNAIAAMAHPAFH
jgi:hypothetical protein